MYHIYIYILEGEKMWSKKVNGIEKTIKQLYPGVPGTVFYGHPRIKHGQKGKPTELLKLQDDLGEILSTNFTISG